jgi:DNA-binding NtrC family response regulator
MPYTALVVEDDAMQRGLLSLLLEESDMKVIQCESAEAARLVLEHSGGWLSIMVTDVELAGVMTGLELAETATQRFPNLTVIVLSGKPVGPVPTGAKFISKPWLPLDILREAERSIRH